MPIVANRCTRLLAAASLCAVVCFTGCQSNDLPEFSIQGIMRKFAPPTPSEAARMTVDLADPDKRRRGVALLSAAPYGGERPYLKLYRLLLDDPDAAVRAAAVKAIGLHGTVDDVKLILPLMDDLSQLVRWEAAKSLQKIHNPIAVKSLVLHLKSDEDEDVRMASAFALGQYPDTTVFSALVGALDDPDFGVAHAAEYSLVTLTGQQLGKDGADWLAWRDANRQTLFAARRPYKWQPFVKQRSLLDKAQFWKEYNKPQPRPPTGLEGQQPTATEDGKSASAAG